MARKPKILATILFPLNAVLFLVGWAFYCLGLKKEENGRKSKIENSLKPINL
jgi:hypothetical protein